jgi:hypothetical protein
LVISAAETHAGCWQKALFLKFQIANSKSQISSKYQSKMTEIPLAPASVRFNSDLSPRGRAYFEFRKLGFIFYLVLVIWCLHNCSAFCSIRYVSQWDDWAME